MPKVNLQSKEARARLQSRTKPYYVQLTPGLALGYRKGAGASGKWIVRQLRAGEKRYSERAFATADDTAKADGVEVMSFRQAFQRAQELVSEYCEEQRTPDAALFYTVEQALADYWEWYQTGREPSRTKQLESKIRIIQNSPMLRGKLISELTPGDVERWHHSLLKQKPTRANGRSGAKAAKPIPSEGTPEFADYLRRRKTTANAYLQVLKAALNRAWRQGLVTDSTAWSRVRPFHGVSEPKVRFLSLDECTRLLNVCPPPFRRIVEAALLTGARFGEISRLTVADYLHDAVCIVLPATITKNGKSRAIPLSAEGVQFFDSITAGRKRSETIFLKANGKPWVRSEQGPHMRRACKAAKIEPAIGFHILRHTHASQLTQAGAPLQVVSAVLGHSDGRITEKHYSHLAPNYVADVVRSTLPSFGVEAGKVVPLKRGRR